MSDDDYHQLQAGPEEVTRRFTQVPDWLQAFAKINPVTVTADAARSRCPAPPASLTAATAWIGGLLAAFIPLSV